MKFERVIVAIDFGRLSMAAARWISTSFAADAELILVHAVEHSRPPDFLAKRDLPFDADAVAEEERLTDRLRRFAHSIRSERIRVAVHGGRAATVIANLARMEKADLVVVGEHARRNPVRDMLSTTAEALLAVCPAPVLLARRVPAHPPHTIVAPIEPSDIAQRVLRTAASLAADWNACVHVIHVLNEHWAGRIAITSSETHARRVEERMLASGREWLDQQMRQAGLESDHAKADVRLGDARQAIIEVASQPEADLIVMGSRGGGGIGQLLLGSVARTVLRAAPCSVLVLTARSTDATTTTVS